MSADKGTGIGSDRSRGQSIGAVFQPALSHRHLITQLTRRGIQSRYRGSALGMLWSLLTPMFMLMIYSFVFSVVFKAKWNHPGAEDANFGVILFSGMIVHALFTEPMVLSASSISSNVQYVKKVVFPLEILAWSTVLVAVFQSLISMLVLLFFMLISGMSIHPTLFLLPIVIAPLLLLSLAVSWFLSATAVYLRDIAQLVGIVSTVLLFISPVFYPVEILPEAWRGLIYLNPISFIVDQLRAVVIYGVQPDWLGLLAYSLLAYVFAWLSLKWFNKLRQGFADVL